MNNGFDINNLGTRKTRIVVPKGWGEEEWIVNKEYCGKILRFHYGKRCSLHFHKLKDEVFLCTKGRILLEIGDNKEALQRFMLKAGDSAHISIKKLHRMTGIDGHNEIIEFSTHHEDSDSYRVEKGD